MTRRRLSFDAGPSGGRVSARYFRPDNARSLLVLAHGAGAGMDHPFMATVAEGLFVRGVGTLRYQFPYMEAGRKRTDTPSVACATVRSAVVRASSLGPDLPLFAGGKSFGGRMTSTAAAGERLGAARGIVFLGFPLHAPGRVAGKRGDHLRDVDVPMLFLQGTRDPLAELGAIRMLCRRVGRRATLHVVEGGDHSFQVLKRSGRTGDEVMDELCDAIASWMRPLAR